MTASGSTENDSGSYRYWHNTAFNFKHFTKIADRAVKEGPQIVTRNGEQMVVVVSLRDYEQRFAPREPLADFFRKSPLLGVDLEVSRERGGRPREAEL